MNNSCDASNSTIPVLPWTNRAWVIVLLGVFLAGAVVHPGAMSVSAGTLTYDSPAQIAFTAAHWQTTAVRRGMRMSNPHIVDDVDEVVPDRFRQTLKLTQLPRPSVTSLLEPMHIVSECARRSMRTSGRHPPR
jgi:acyl-CoA synthetase (AMP-forming)/AMP-acid ligase II